MGIKLTYIIQKYCYSIRVPLSSLVACKGITLAVDKSATLH